MLLEGQMTVSLKSRLIATILIFSTVFFLAGCAAQQTRTQNLVTTEYFLQKAGFQELPVNLTTPKRQALLNSIPRGMITTFQKGGKNYYAYTDENAQRLYIGDPAAYQKYEALTHGRNLCERVVAPDSTKFWSCYQEYKALGGTKVAK